MDDQLKFLNQSAMSEQRRRPRVVILGAGFGGLSAAKALKSANADVVILDRHNYHLFQPLLYQVATAGLSPNQIATPIRQILSRQRNATVLMDRVVDVDLDTSEVVTPARRIGFDFLIVATGARHAYFGHDDWEAVAPGLKKIDEATDIRKRLLLAFEVAENTADAEMRQVALTFVVVGGGPTGVEMAGAIAELARNTIMRDFRNINTCDTRVVLVEAGPRLLPSFPEKLSASAEAQLRKLKVEVIRGDPVVECSASGVRLQSGAEFDAAMIVWGAGVMASPAARWLKSDADRAGRVIVGPDLRLPGHPNILVIGDTAAITDAAGHVVPGVAPAAKQMGQHAARAVVAMIAGRKYPPFVYRNYGNLATIGRKAAVADFGRLRLAGFAAWLVWGFVHVGFLIGFRNRISVMLDWAWSYFTFGRGARLITGDDR
ncbi:NADH dehydrogenase [Defluviimonas aquaemixtae]|uniref:NADH:ubiquinone reductase (non-electrogenic) n=1 Tax=Albidovulum aquaemixtae TaxID=1542388 RepID=A0A2R8B4I2_9RHOB|nr:NAD(P)/FAD-dependent oxidoreductase [Defluviimonas aquaemixtae]SPH17516.1 NADH dehydrogenase [Defluviimonas aquaemixtae]